MFNQTNKKDNVETVHIADLLNYRAYDPSTGLFHQEDSVCFMLSCNPLCGSSSDVMQTLADYISEQLPESAILQTLLWASPEIGGVLSHYCSTRSAGFEQTLAHLRSDYFLKKSWETGDDAPLVLRDFRLLLVLTFPTDASEYSMTNSRLQLKNTLASIDIVARALDPTDMLAWVRGICFADPAPSRAWSKNSPLNEQVVSPGVSVSVNSDCLSMFREGHEPLAISTLSVSEFPRMWHGSGMGECIGSMLKENLNFPCPFLINLIIKPIPKEASNKKAAVKLLRNEQLANSALGKLLPRARKVVNDWQQVIQCFDEGKTLVEVCMQVVVVSRFIERERGVTQARQCWQRLGFSLDVDSYLQLPMWQASFPGQVDHRFYQSMRQCHRFHTVLSDNAAHLMPLQGEYKGSKSPCLLLTGRRGQVCYFSPFDSDGGNYNTAVAGKSGSGKSVLMQELMSGVLGLGGKVFVLDVGRSFERACHLHGGEFVAFDMAEPVNLNPFTHIRDFPESLSMLKPLIGAMASSDKMLGGWEMSVLEQAIVAAWNEKGCDATITNVAQFLAEHKDVRARDLGTLLYPFSKEGMYGAFFEGPCSLSFSNDLIVLELEELKSKKDLQQVVLMLLMYHVTESMYRGNRERPIACIIDEAWDLLRGDMAGEIMETGCRRARKYQGAFIAGTQSVNDFYQTPASIAAFENSDNLLLLSQKEEAIDLLAKEDKLSMPDGMKTLLKSLKTKKGQYSEMLIKTAQGYCVTRLILDPFARTLYSSSPDVFAKINALCKQGFTLVEAIKQVQWMEQNH